MKTRLVLLLLTALVGQLATAQDNAGGSFIRLVDPLDEPEFYCLDLAGWGKSLQLDDPLQAHTCKPQAFDDQLFQVDGKRVKVIGTDRCVQVAGSGGVTLPGSAVLVRACANNPLQEILLTDKGLLQIVGTGYCIGAGGESRPASGPSHVWRTLTVIDCAKRVAAQSTWQIVPAK